MITEKYLNIFVKRKNKVKDTDYINFIHDKYGYCYYMMEPNKKPLIFNLFTEPKYRRQGHAKRHLEIVINTIRRTGYEGPIEIEASPPKGCVERDILIEFYKRMNLTVINE